MKLKELLIKVRTVLQQIKFFFVDCFGWYLSLWIYLFRDIKKPGIFYGYYSYFWASKYAEKRTQNWKCHWDQLGKQQGVFPITDTKLIVCSRLELKRFKKLKIIKGNFKPRKAIKKSYYTTEL